MPCEYEYLLTHGDGRDDREMKEEVRLRIRLREEAEDAAAL